MQGTGGSSAIANSNMQLCMAGAAARQMLVAAAERWNVDVEGISVENGMVRHGSSGCTARFGELAEGAAARQAVPEDPPLKSAEEFKLIGRDVPRKDGGKLDGTAVYSQDIHLPGQLTAVVAHPPRFGAVVRDFDAA